MSFGASLRGVAVIVGLVGREGGGEEVDGFWKWLLKLNRLDWLDYADCMEWTENNVADKEMEVLEASLC